MQKNFKNNILVSITGSTDKEWQSKLAEIEKYKITEVALFVEIFKRPKQRWNIYHALQKSCVKKIPFVHIREDVTKDELQFLQNNFKTKYFNIHETGFSILEKWRGFYKHLYLEMNYNNQVPRNVKVKKIGGFCVDLSHFKASEEKWGDEFKYILKRRHKKELFVCNHLNGYGYKTNKDVHTVTSLKQFEYLKTLPEFVFGKIIAIETFNSIKDQLKFRDHVVKLLNKKFNS